jgi:hypothetical protein
MGRRSPSPAVRFNGECDYCGKFGHMKYNCRKRDADSRDRGRSGGRPKESQSRHYSSK